MLTTNEQKEFDRQIQARIIDVGHRQMKQEEMERLVYKSIDPLKVLLALEREGLLWI